MALALVLGDHTTPDLQLVAVVDQTAMACTSADMDPGTQSDVEMQHGVRLTSEEPGVAEPAIAVHVVIVAHLREVHRRWFTPESHRQRAQHGAGREQFRSHRWHRIRSRCRGNGDHRWRPIVERSGAGRPHGAVGSDHRQRPIVVEASLDEFAVVHRRDEAGVHRRTGQELLAPAIDARLGHVGPHVDPRHQAATEPVRLGNHVVVHPIRRVGCGVVRLDRPGPARHQTTLAQH